MNQEDDSDVVAVERRKLFDERAPAYLKMLLAIIFSIIRDRELTNEIVQETFAKYVSRREDENWQTDVENEGAYLTTIAKNLLKDRWKAQGKHESVSLDAQLDDALMSQLTRNSDIENQIYFKELLDQLPSKIIFGKFNEYQTDLLRLYVSEQMSYEEIAELINENVIVVKFRLKAIFMTIRQRMKKIYGNKGLFKSDT